MFTMNQDDISNFILDNLELYIIVTILVIIWVIKSTKKNSPNGAPIRRKKNIDDLIKNDPVLNKLDDEIGEINRQSWLRTRKNRKTVAKLILTGQISGEGDDYVYSKKENLEDFYRNLFGGPNFNARLLNSKETKDFIIERFQFEKRISKAEYSKCLKIIKEWELVEKELKSIELKGIDDFEDIDEMKELKLKKDELTKKLDYFRKKIYDYISKVAQE